MWRHYKKIVLLIFIFISSICFADWDLTPIQVPGNGDLF